MNNKIILQDLFEREIIDVENAEFLFDDPKPIDPAPKNKALGAVVGTIIGDALGIPTEGKAPDKRFGEIKYFSKKSRITDDSEMTLIMLDVFIDEGWFNPEKIAYKFANVRINGKGGTVKRFIKNFKRGVPWKYAGEKRAGNGALMRISAIPAGHVFDPCCLRADAAVTSMITHNDRLAISSAVAFAEIMWELFSMESPPEPEYYIDRYVEIARVVEGDDTKYRPRFGVFKNFVGPAWEYVERVITVACNNEWSLFELNKNVGSGGYLLETIPIVIYAMMLYDKDPFVAVSKAVTYSKDSDSVGAIVGALSGALHGYENFPSHVKDPVIGERILLGPYKKMFKKVKKFLS